MLKLQRGLFLVGVSILLLAGPHARAAHQGPRTVDLVDVSDPQSEAAHGYAGRAVAVGRWRDRAWRATRDSFSYEVRIFDDSPVSLECTFVPADGEPAVDVLLDGRVLPRPSWTPAGDLARAGDRGVVRLHAPAEWTVGRTAATTTFRARNGAWTPGLLAVRVVQEHLE